VTAALHSVGADDGAEITKVDIIFSRELQVSTVHRLAVSYESDGQQNPRTLFLKLCKPLPLDSTPVAARSEVDFYTTAAPQIGSPPLIRVYDAAFSSVSGESHLLMEDLTDTHSQPEQNTAPSSKKSRLAVEALAKAHARWSSSPQLGNGVGTVFGNDWLSQFIANLNKSVGEFIGSSAVALTAKQRIAYRVMLKAAPKIWGRLTDPCGLTVTHGDAHWWNFLYPDDATSDTVRIIDWQLWHIDLGARDLAFLLAHGGFAPPRPELEGDLLRHYHDVLITNAVTGYSFEKLHEDYRWSAIRNLNLPVIFRSQGKHSSTWKTALERSFDAFERLNCIDLIT
jgi:hypothetical protein